MSHDEAFLAEESRGDPKQTLSEKKRSKSTLKEYFWLTDLEGLISEFSLELKALSSAWADVV